MVCWTPTVGWLTICSSSSRVVVVVVLKVYNMHVVV